MKSVFISIMSALFLFGYSTIAFADKKGASADGQEVTPICKCICYRANEGGGEHPGFSSKIWFKATSDTVCSVNNDAECSGETSGGVRFAGKTKECVKAFKKK